jgi:hypothetical protein
LNAGTTLAGVIRSEISNLHVLCLVHRLNPGPCPVRLNNGTRDTKLGIYRCQRYYDVPHYDVPHYDVPHYDVLRGFVPLIFRTGAPG